MSTGTTAGVRHFIIIEKSKLTRKPLVEDNFPALADKSSNEEIAEFQIKPFSIKNERILSFIEHIYKNVDETIAKSNNTPQEVFDRTEEGYDRHYLMLVFNEKVYGIATLNYDQTALGSHRCYIRSLFTILPTHLAKALDTVVKYIWEKLLCDHVRVEINHFNDSTGQLKVDNLVKSVYSSKGFRWKTL